MSMFLVSQENRPGRTEWAIALTIAIFATLLFILPYMLGHILALPNEVFSGIWFNIDDGSYLSVIHQGLNNHWTYRNLFTTEPHEAVFIQGFYLSLGHLGRLLNLTVVQTWHLSLVLANLTLFIVLYQFLAQFLSAPKQRLFAYLLAIFGAGYDWFQFPTWLERAAALEAVPIDLFMPEAHLFYSALTFPHFSAGTTLLLLIFWWSLRALMPDQKPGRGWWYAFLAGLGNLLLIVIYPFLILLTAAVLGVFYVYLLRRARSFLWSAGFKLLIIFSLPIPLLAYYLLVLMNNAVMRAWNAQAVTLSPNPIHYILTYAPYLLLGVWTLRYLRDDPTRVRDRLVFLWIWVGCVAVLLYLPINPQRRFVEGLQVPLAILASWGLFATVLPRIMRTRAVQALTNQPRYSQAGISRLVLFVVFAGTCLFNAYLYLGTVATLGLIQPYPVFRPQAEIEAMDWLKENTPPSAVVLGSYWTGSYLPGRSGNTVFVGHLYETIDFTAKRELANRFFSPDTPADWRRSFIEQQAIDFVFIGPHERQFEPFSLEEDFGGGSLDLVYQNEQVRIYRARSP
jgi:hypothetical protein